MPGTDALASIEVAGLGRWPIAPNAAAITIYDADDVRTVVIDSTGALVSALVATNITTADDVLLSLGTGTDARFSWDTTDANANEMLLQLPAGGAVNVPVLAIGQSIESVDLGLYNGVTEPRIAIFGVGAVTTAPVIEFRKARGSIASPTVVTSGDDLGTINFYGAVAAGEYVLGASIRADMAGTIATTRGPSTLTFLTATDAAPSVLTAALTLGAAQQATIGGALTVTTTSTFNGNLVLPANTDLTFTGTTGTNDIVLTNGLADALSITDGAADVLVIDTSTAGNVITITAAMASTGNYTLTGALALVAGTAPAGTVAYAVHDNAGDVTINALTGKAILLAINGIDVVTLTATVLTFAGTIGATGAGSRVVQSYHTNITSTNAVTVDSSETVKHDIHRYDADALAVIGGMDVITFRHDEWLDTSGDVKLGIRAESVAEPLAITRIEREGGGYPGVNLYGLAAVMTKAIQQLTAKVERLEEASAVI